MDIKKIIALNIYTLRNKYKLTQEEFATKLNATGGMSITRGHISRIENGNHTPSAEFIKTVSIAFNVPSDWILANREYNNADKLLSDKELNLIAHYRRLSPALQEKIFELINSILES